MRQSIVERRDVGDDRLLVWMIGVNILRIEQSIHTELPLCRSEGVLKALAVRY